MTDSPRGAGVSSPPDRPCARLVIEALRLDRLSGEEVERRAARGLELGVGGFILFGGEADEVAGLTSRLLHEAGRPLWFGADLERGAGQQFRGLTELPPPASFAHFEDPESAARQAGRTTGLEATSIGVSWVLAPVLDLDAERRNPIVATRSFGADPERVARLAAAWIEGCQAAGALACAKHFPGHGRTRDDSHIGLPVVPADRETLESDLLPFRRVADDVATMMVAHVAFPALGGRGPATTDAAIVAGLLRDRIGFAGPVATDAMIMGAIEDDARAAVAAVRAGCDLILYPSDAARTIDALEGAAANGLGEHVDAALARSGRALEAFAPPPGGDRARGGARPSTVERAWTRDEATGFAEGAIVGDPDAFRSWSPDAATRVVGVSDDPDIGPPAGREGPLASILRARLEAAGWRTAPSPEAEQVVVVLAATPRGWKGRVGISEEAGEQVRRARASGTRSVVVLLGHARDAGAFDPPVLCAWSTESVMERAAADWLSRAAGGLA